MITNRALDAVVAHWQAELDGGLETGETPVFYLGHGTGVLGELTGPLALQWLDDERHDTRMPLAAGGGLAPFWLAALLHQRSAGAPLLSPATVFSYTGPDRATHAAALNLLDTRRSPFRRRPADLPPGLQPMFVANQQAGPFAAEVLPLQLASGMAQAAYWENATQSAAVPALEAEAAAAAARRDGWVAWTAVVAAVALLLIALVA
jgi:hypothetical protein